MTFETNIMLFLTFLNVLTAVFSMLSPNPMMSLLFLMLMFSNAFLYLMILGLEFLSFLILLMYVGAMSMLFMFVLMMLDMKVLLMKKYSYKNMFYFFSFFLMNLYLFFKFLNMKIKDLFYLNNDMNEQWIIMFYNTSDMQSMGISIFNNYLFHFIMMTFMLFVVLMGSIAMAKSKNMNFQNNLKVKYNFNDLIFDYDYKKFITK